MSNVTNHRFGKNNLEGAGLHKKGKVHNKGLNKYDRVMNGIAVWASFYRANVDKFVEDYLGIKLKFFQVILLYMMNHMNYFIYIASRG